MDCSVCISGETSNHDGHGAWWLRVHAGFWRSGLGSFYFHLSVVLPRQSLQWPFCVLDCCHHPNERLVSLCCKQNIRIIGINQKDVKMAKYQVVTHVLLWLLQQLATTYSGKQTLRNLLLEEIHRILPYHVRVLLFIICWSLACSSMLVNTLTCYIFHQICKRFRLRPERDCSRLVCGVSSVIRIILVTSLWLCPGL